MSVESELIKKNLERFGHTFEQPEPKGDPAVAMASTPKWEKPIEEVERIAARIKAQSIAERKANQEGK